VHLGPFSRFVVGRIDAQIEAIDMGRWVQPPLMSLPAATEPPVAKLVA
jgi:hypothetical protein